MPQKNSALLNCQKWYQLKRYVYVLCTVILYGYSCHAPITQRHGNMSIFSSAILNFMSTCSHLKEYLRCILTHVQMYHISSLILCTIFIYFWHIIGVTFVLYESGIRSLVCAIGFDHWFQNAEHKSMQGKHIDAKTTIHFIVIYVQYLVGQWINPYSVLIQLLFGLLRKLHIKCERGQWPQRDWVQTNCWWSEPYVIL